MQNRYAGDIGDYSKFVLLKKLFKNENIGLVWYLYSDENHNNDGIHKNYQNYNLKDKELIQVLETVANSERNIENLEKN